MQNVSSIQAFDISPCRERKNPLYVALDRFTRYFLLCKNFVSRPASKEKISMHSSKCNREEKNIVSFCICALQLYYLQFLIFFSPNSYSTVSYFYALKDRVAKYKNSPQVYICIMYLSIGLVLNVRIFIYIYKDPSFNFCLLQTVNFDGAYRDCS
jgi:hypothetical protein